LCLVQGSATAVIVEQRRTEFKPADQTRGRRRFQTVGSAEVGRRTTGRVGVDDPTAELQFGTVEAVQVEIVGLRRTATRFRRRRFAPGTAASADERGSAEKCPAGNGDDSTGRTGQRGVRTGQTAERRVIR